MSQSLRSMSKADQRKTITRRLKEKKGGLGYWAAVEEVKLMFGPMPLPIELLSQMMPEEPNREPIKHQGLTGKQWSNRKSRSKLAKASRKRNRR